MHLESRWQTRLRQQAVGRDAGQHGGGRAVVQVLRAVRGEGGGGDSVGTRLRKPLLISFLAELNLKQPRKFHPP
jgi:hypothetical protein